ncbi:unnamed protein product [Sphagnum balticum]
MHFATVAYVSEVWLDHYSEFTFVEVPISLHIFVGDTMYYCNTLMLLDAMKAHKVKILIYSSTCATYGKPKRDANHRRYTAGKLTQDLQLGSN